MKHVMRMLLPGLLALGVLHACFGADVKPVGEPDWLLENALEDEALEFSLPDLTTPGEFNEALADYAQGRYRLASSKLEKLRVLNLPNGLMDFLVFALAECYRKAGMAALAERNYRFVLNEFPESKKVPASLFRLLELAYHDRNVALGDSLLDVFTSRHFSHPLYNAVAYTVAKLYYRTERYGEAIEFLLKVPRNSAFHLQAQFLSALCFISVNKEDKALFHLDYVRKNTFDEALLSETAIVIGDIYYSKENAETALKFFLGVPRVAERYFYALVKTARVYTDLKMYDQAMDIARAFIKEHGQSEYYFEMASLLEEIYRATGDKERADRIGMLVEKQISNARLAFDVDRELRRVLDMIRAWHDLRLWGRQSRDAAMIEAADNNIAQLEKLRDGNEDLIYSLMGESKEDGPDQLPGMAERRYLDMIRDRMAALQDTVEERFRAYGMAMADEGDADFTVEARGAKKKSLDSAQAELAGAKAEYREVRDMVQGVLKGTGVFSDQMQAKFIDWAFARQQTKKADFAEMNRDLSERERKKETKAQEQEPDSLEQKGTQVVSMFVEFDRDKLANSIKVDRQKLVDHMETFINASPNSKYSAQVLMRFAELHYDRSQVDFGKRLLEYEEALASGDGTADIEYPDIDLEDAIAAYDKIIVEFPKEWVADDAHFYKALSLQKVGREEEANRVFLALIQNYPESEFFVEANMSVGRYYFENPKIEDGKGYELAEEAYRRVLHFRDHPQFVEALYHLGWCYYMQNSFDEAIAVFKYLIEEVDLDFDPTAMEEKQLANPLLRGEAVDYIAISFDEGHNVDEAIRFLELIGNPDYAAMVLMRIGELREEDLDYTACLSVYNRLLQEYPNTSIAPDASVRLIKVYESLNRSEDAIKEREMFFKRYRRGGPWQKAVAVKYPGRIEVVDSMAISLGLFVADQQFRLAETTQDTAIYRSAARNYSRLVDAYAGDSKAAEAYWNMAIILDTKLNDAVAAYLEYLSFADLPNAPNDRKEQAVLNAIALAQRMLPPDTAVKDGELETAAVRVVEAAKRYITLFPEGKEVDDVILTTGSLYFNRKMYTSAASTYRQITNRGQEASQYYQAQFLIGKCLFAEEKWIPASEAFEVVYTGVADSTRKDDALKLMLQARFLNAKQLADAQAHEKAAEAYTSIEVDYPGSEYGDASLFNAAEAYEKLEQWNKAYRSYHTLYKTYPYSKLAPDALFNAATDYEKVGKFDKAAEVYEILVREYPTSPKAKDGLFNVGFCYEKLGQLDKMAEANERYTQLYPGEKDVEAMLIRSAEYYFKAEMYEKSLNVYRNYARRYPKTGRSVEAIYMIARCMLAQGDTSNALLSFQQAEQHNKRIILDGGKANNYFAGEAAYKIATINRVAFRDVALQQEGQKLKDAQKRKTDLLSVAAKGYQRVMQYKSERMFEAAYRIGEMYENFAHDWSEQKRFEEDPIKAALAEKDIALVSSSLLQQSFAPYRKVLDIAGKLDSIGTEPARWVDSVKAALGDSYFEAGEYMFDAIRAMHSAPIPKEIAGQPLFLFQYKKQLYETLEPMKVQARDYYYLAYNDLKEIGLSEEASRKCLNEFARITFLIGNDYDKLSEEILVSTDNLPKDLDQAEREELIFQFEDIVFELQDKAMFAYEDGLELLRSKGAAKTKWYGRLLGRLARLNPETYGKAFFLSLRVQTGSDWFVRNDQVRGWNSDKVPVDGWEAVKVSRKADKPRFLVGNADPIWSADGLPGTKYFWRPVFLNGEPQDAAVYFASSGAFNLYINGQRVAADTSVFRSLTTVDSLTSIHSLLRGGDNVLSAEVTTTDSVGQGFALVFTAMIDTSKHFETGVKLPKGVKRDVPKPVAVTVDDAAAVDAAVVSGSPDASLDYANQFKNRGELVNAIQTYQANAAETEQAIRRERLAVQKLHIKHDHLDNRIAEVKKDIDELKASIEGMQRER